MLIHEFTRTTPNKPKKRVGRGGKRGTFSGRGTKGQKARAGRNIRPAERELVQRLPKLRGASNTRKAPEVLAINVGQLDKLGIKEVTLNSLITKGILPKSHRRPRVKILGNGDVKTAITIKNLPVSKSAQTKIEAAGGKVISE